MTVLPARNLNMAVCVLCQVFFLAFLISLNSLQGAAGVIGSDLDVALCEEFISDPDVV